MSGGNYKLIQIGEREQEEREQLLPSDEPKTQCCTPTRFTISTLAGLVCLLTAVLFCLIRWPIRRPWCDNMGREGVMEPGPQDTLLGLISDIHLNLHPDECVGQSSSEYGVFGCDSTLGLLNLTLKDMVTKLPGSKSRVLVMLGDAAQHQPADTWDYKVTLDSISSVFKQFQHHFPSTPVFPTVGNNDLPAHNTVPDISWYTSLLKMFEPAITRGHKVTLPDNFREIFMYGGYYSALFADKFTVISLNTNLFSASVQDRSSQREYAVSHLQWLSDTLDAVTGRVVIIGHIPPTLSLYALYHNKVAKVSWRLEYFENFREIYRRHHEKVIAMLFGHEHQDTFVVERNSGVDMATFTFPSVSPIYSGQPSYGIAVIQNHGNERKLKDIFTYHTWLDYYTRLRIEPKFLTYRSFGQIFRLNELTPEGLFNKTKNIIEESDGMRSFMAVKGKVYQERAVPMISPHLYYCYTTNFNIAAFRSVYRKFWLRR
ncbi:sphingomyelinase phosphodiesterase C-like [Bolinopsis microptera]|uniref:sphingomyelinase phosphodiesterase C-like n=1 Tax=Bolinopsis microptera TaxID=2820187 RepID=UPI0030799F63